MWLTWLKVNKKNKKFGILIDKCFYLVFCKSPESFAVCFKKTIEIVFLTEFNY